MKIKLPKKFDASDRRISDLIFESSKRKCWGECCKNRGDLRESEVHMEKYRNAVKALKTLGYTVDI